MKVLIAPNAFKGTLSPQQVAIAMEKGVKRAHPSIKTIIAPQADGGNGSMELILKSHKGIVKQAKGLDQFGKKTHFNYAILKNKTAVLEIATICGLTKKSDPSQATSHGVGDVILDALNNGVRKFIVCLGGSGTNDGGAGMLQALGIEFLDKFGKSIPYGGLALAKLDKISFAKLDPRIKESSFTVLCDVVNPLVGKQGCSIIFSPQKGANKATSQKLEKAMQHYAKIIEKTLRIKISKKTYLGAAGGIAAAFHAFLNGKIVSGSNWFLQLSGVEEIVEGVDLILTGEGRIDDQVLYEKSLFAIARLGKTYQKPVVAIVGGVGTGYEKLYDIGVTAIFPLSYMPIDKPKNSSELIANLTEQVIRFHTLMTSS